MFSRSAIYTAVCGAILATPAIAGGGFSASCSGYGVSGTTLTANCSDGKGGSRWSSIDLNRCIANYNGNLVCAANGGFGGSCSGCGIRTGAYMICGCRGGSNPTPIANLDDCVANYGGNLACAT
ncbi:CVNH domain protein [Ceratobasidium sp. AG-Ba]|nr:CVNH domain protein [Ceratobasidium sp. AG-Ba]QRW02769.1 CVNH domain protein [Ceratobasidium sp. AG-Ba]